MQGVYNIADLRALAKKRLPRGLFEYVDRGSEDERALANNREALARVKLRPRVLRDVGERQLQTMLFGKTNQMPLAISPTAVAGMLWYDGEVEAAKAAKAAGIPFTLSTVGICSPEEVRAASGAPFWFQLYMLRDRGAVVSLLERAA
ncbi:MAG TPA: alpha-hydroxy-acid oxidizing protein, partial [Burkholderiales bacterium]|nr:alpha-hydroxy-acid oxidizing protein [Burkholderiales bacterium]